MKFKPNKPTIADRILEAACRNPLAELAAELHTEGHTSEEIHIKLKDVIPDTARITIVNHLRDLEKIKN